MCPMKSGYFQTDQWILLVCLQHGVKSVQIKLSSAVDSVSRRRSHFEFRLFRNFYYPQTRRRVSLLKMRRHAASVPVTTATKRKKQEQKEQRQAGSRSSHRCTVQDHKGLRQVCLKGAWISHLSPLFSPLFFQKHEKWDSHSFTTL